MDVSKGTGAKLEKEGMSCRDFGTAEKSPAVLTADCMRTDMMGFP